MEENLYATAGTQGDGIGAPIGLDVPPRTPTKSVFEDPSVHGMDAGWLASAFSGFGVDICGQRLTPDMAKKLIFALLSCVGLLLLVLLIGGSSGRHYAGDYGSGGAAGNTGITVVINAHFQLVAGASASLHGVSFRRSYGKSFDATFSHDIATGLDGCGIAATDVAVVDMAMVGGVAPSVTAEITMRDIAAAYRCAHILVVQASAAECTGHSLRCGHAGALVNWHVPVVWTINEETPLVPGACGPASCIVPHHSRCQDKVGGHSCVCPPGTQDLDGVCAAAEPDYMSCTADESKKTCADFPTITDAQKQSGSPSVCGISDIPHVGCSAGKTFQEALAICVTAGARLCTLAEVLNNEVRLSGCNNFEAARVWTSSRDECPEGQVKSSGDFNAATSATRAPACTDITESFNMAVRCCVDEAPLCEAGEPCHPRGSLLTCNELNWETTGDIGTAANGGVQQGGGYGSDYQNVCGESDAWAGGCDVGSTVNFETAANLCMGVGARLCTLSEILLNEGRGTGCQFDDNMTWTSTQHGCPAGQVNTIIGSDEFRGSEERCGNFHDNVYPTSPCPAGPVCADMQSRLATARCCADADRKCFSEGDSLPSVESADQQWMQCTADESLKTCGELGWEMNVQHDDGWTNPASGTQSVCANSKVGPPSDDHPEGTCSLQSTFMDALSLCVHAEARLCTLQEILNHEAAGSGCALGHTRVWTSAREECGQLEAMTVAGGAAVAADDAAADIYLNPPACTSMHEPHGVRCCADAIRKCPAGAPCHPKSSLLTCEEHQALAPGNFGNANQFGSATVCAETDILGSGCSTHASYYDAANTCMGGGARLCTADELAADETANTGCHANVYFAWSSSQSTCGSGSVMAVMGATTFSSSPPVCKSMLSGSAAVRCCADTERECFNEGSHANALRQFRAFPHHAIGGHNIWCSDNAGHGMTPEYCAIECLRHDNCVSFQVRASDGRCCIQDQTRASVGCTQTACAGGQTYHIDVEYTYYEKRSASDSFGCTADQSLRTCGELGWLAKDSPNVCSNTELNSHVHDQVSTGSWGGATHVNATFPQALAMCVEAGARLCTLDEVMSQRTAAINDVTNHNRVWTSSREECGTNQVKTAPGKPENVNRWPVQCTDIHTGLSPQNRRIGVVCCADRERSCAEGAPCHPESSLLTCTELGWDQNHNSGQVGVWAGNEGTTSYHGRRSVCASSMEPNDFGTSGGLSQVELAAGVPTCQNGVNYYRAADTCMMVGARLCTEQELTNDETRYSGCGFDSQYVWSSTQGNCGRHRVRQAVGSTAHQAASPAKCASMTDDVGAVRCCADMNRMCFDEGSGAVDAAFYGQTGAPEPGSGCGVEESLSTCRELGWYLTEGARNILQRGQADGADLNSDGQADVTRTTDDTEDVCAESELNFRLPGQAPGTSTRTQRGCMPAIDFKTALKTCVDNNARLCTLTELMRDEARGSGCGHDSQRIWTSTIDECPPGFMKTGPGKSGNLDRIPVQCTPISEDQNVFVRCCADAHRTCGGATPCHPSSSLLTCDDLGWEEVTGDTMAQGPCDRQNCQSFAGSSYEVCAASQAMTGECLSSATFYEAANVCLAAGARLCTEEEILADETTFTGCGFDSHWVWSSSTGNCGHGQVLQLIGSSEMRTQPPRCQPMLSGLAAVRCCADRYRTCFSQGSKLDTFSSGVCTADESLHTCGELGWLVGTEGQGVCGQSELHHSYGFDECPETARVIIPDVTCTPGQDPEGSICANPNTPSPGYCSWRPNEHGADMFVCERCSIRANGDCFEEADFSTALAMCVGIGARLCTQEELERDEARGTGCNMDNARIWSSSRENCGPNEVVTVAGSSRYAGRHPTLCVNIIANQTTVPAHGVGPNHVPEQTVSLGIRCCADSSRTCSDGPCHPTASLLTCEELNGLGEEWPAAAGSLAPIPGEVLTDEVCAESDINGACHYGTFTEAANLCMSVGARLCSIEEIIAEETRYTGCNFDRAFIWSASQNHGGATGQNVAYNHFQQCNDGQVLVAIGSGSETCEFNGGNDCAGSQTSHEAMCVPLTARDVNVAEGKPAFADSVFSPDAGHPCDPTQPASPGCYSPSKAFDGLVGNAFRWLSDGTQPRHWLAVDLQGVYPINAIHILSGHDHGTDPGTPDYDPRIGICTFDVQFFCNDATIPTKGVHCDDPGSTIGALSAQQAADDSKWISLKSGSDGPYTTVTLRSPPEDERHFGQLTVEPDNQIPLVTARYMRLKVDQSCNDGGGEQYANIARIYEFKVMTSIGIRCCADSEKMCSDRTCDETLEAEAAVLGSSADPTAECDPTSISGPSLVTRGNLNGAAGTGYVQLNTPHDTITWSLDSCTAGMHALTFRYALGATGGEAMHGGNRNEMSISVTEATGSGSTVMHFHSTGGWDYWATKTVQVRLAEGTNTVALSVSSQDTGGGELPNIDWMKVELITDPTGLGNVCNPIEGFKYIPSASDLGNPDATMMTDDEVCGEDNVLRHDGIAAGLSYAGHGAGVTAGGQHFTSCVIADLGATVTASAIAFAATSSDEAVCGDTCVVVDGDTTSGCGSLATLQLYVLGGSSTKERDLVLSDFTPIGQVALPLDDTADNGEHARWLTQSQQLPSPQPVRYVAACRSATGGGRDNVLVDYLGVVPAGGEQCP